MTKKLNKRKKDNKKKGFTLVELIVVIAILGILAVITIPRFSQYVEEARMQKIESNSRTVYEACVAAETDLIANGEEVSRNNLIEEAGKSLPGIPLIGSLHPDGCEPGTFGIERYIPATDTEGSKFTIVYYGGSEGTYIFVNGELTDIHEYSR